MSEGNQSALKQTDESVPTYSKRAKLYILGLLSSLVLGLVVSLLSSGTDYKKAEKTQSEVVLEKTPEINFHEQVKFEQNHSNTETATEATFSDTRDDAATQAAWQQKEQLRVLDARRAHFDLDSSKKLDVKNNYLASLIKNARDAQQLENFNLSEDSVARPGFMAPAHDRKAMAEKSGAFLSEDSAAKPGFVSAAHDRKAMTEKSGALLIPTGTVIDAVLDQAISSDYTGPWKGHLVRDVYSVDNQFVLLPKGTKIMGQSLRIGNVNEPIQNRISMTVEWCILPNGQRIDFHKNAPVDQAGVAAFEGSVDRHFAAQFLGVAAYALISASMPRDALNASGVSSPSFQGQLADGVRSMGQPLATKYLSLVPTVTLPLGLPIKVVMQDDLYVRPWGDVNSTVYG